MAAISQKIGNLIGGVSQQPDTNKYNGQLRICDNYYPDAATGLIKRPGLKGIGKLANAVDDGTWFHIFRDDNERYIFQFSKAGALKIWDADNGIQQTVNAVAAESIAYAVHRSFDDLETLQINDYIFVLNRTKVVAQGSTSSSAYAPFGFVNINTVAFNTDYTITIDGIDFVHTTPSNASGSNKNSIDTIINNPSGAHTGLVTLINGNANYVAQGIGNTIFIRRANNADFSLKAKGGTVGNAVEAFKETVTSVAQLPREFLSDRRIKVEGSADSGSDNYWVKFIPSTAGQTSGVGHWEETIAPGTILGMNTETLPHVVIREANGTFTFRQLDEASATASAGTTAVTGIPTAISITSATSGGHVVGEEFAPTGGTGKNLRLTVTKVKTDTVSNTYAANSSSHVRQVKTTSTGRFSITTTRYDWYLAGVKIGQTSGSFLGTPATTLVIGDTTYLVNGAFQTVGAELQAGLTAVQVRNGVIDTISILQAGQGYTATNTVSNKEGDTFQIVTVNTQNLEGDAFRLNYWKGRAAGDSETNPFPSFVNNTIDGISFFKNRIIFTSRQNVVCSQAGDYFNFFASTVITIVDSDPIDLSASSLKPIRLKHMLPVPRGLLMFGDNGQYILETTTEAFAPKTAEINPLSSNSQSDVICPVDIGSTFLLLEEGTKAATVFEMDVQDNVGGKPRFIELTRLIPTYIPSAIVRMRNSQTTGTVAMLSKQQPDWLYLYRFFQQGDSRISGWFRWELPGTIESFDFYQDILYVITKHGSNYVLSSMSLLTDTPGQTLLFEGQYIDVRLDLFDYNPVLVYKSATDTTRVCFKDGFEDMDNQPVLMHLNPDVAGYFEEQTLQYDAAAPTGQKYFLVADGNQTTSKFAIGYKYEALAQLPAFYFVRDEGRAVKDTLNIPRVSRITVNSYNSGPYKAIVRAQARHEFELHLPQIKANNYNANNIPIIRNAQSSIPILAKGDQFEFELIADAPFPTAFTSLNWEGTYNNKGVQSL
jgi:hypothetical protein